MSKRAKNSVRVKEIKLKNAGKRRELKGEEKKANEFTLKSKYQTAYIKRTNVSVCAQMSRLI